MDMNSVNTETRDHGCVPTCSECVNRLVTSCSDGAETSRSKCKQTVSRQSTGARRNARTSDKDPVYVFKDMDLVFVGLDLVRELMMMMMVCHFEAV